MRTWRLRKEAGEARDKLGPGGGRIISMMEVPDAAADRRSTKAFGEAMMPSLGYPKLQPCLPPVDDGNFCPQPALSRHGRSVNREAGEMVTSGARFTVWGICSLSDEIRI